MQQHAADTDSRCVFVVRRALCYGLNKMVGKSRIKWRCENEENTGATLAPVFNIGDNDQGCSSSAIALRIMLSSSTDLRSIKPAIKAVVQTRLI